MAQDILQVQVDDDMNQAAGTFRLSFAPRTVNGRTYDQLIPLGSLIMITTQDAVTPLSEADSTIMVGRTEDHAIQEDFSRASPRRQVTISGRSMAGVLLDAFMLYHPGLDKQGGGLSTQEALWKLQTPTQLTEANLDPRQGLAIVLTYFLGLPSHAPLLDEPGPLVTAQAVQQEQAKVQAVDPTLTPPQAQGKAREAVRRRQGTPAPKAPRPPAPVAERTNVEVLQTQARIAQLRKENPTLSLREAALQAADEIEENGVMAPVQTQPLPKAPVPPPAPQVTPQPAPAPAPALPPAPRVPITQGGGQLVTIEIPGRTMADVLDMNNAQWNLFEDKVTVPNAVNTPFANSVWNFCHLFVDPLFQEFFTRVDEGKVKIYFRSKPFLKKKVMTGTRFRDDDPTCHTVELDPADLLASQLRRQSASIYNVFLILPMHNTTKLDTPGALYQLFPVGMQDPDDPSYVRRHGIRLLKHQSPYMSGMLTVPGTPANQRWETIRTVSRRWATIASHWYGYAPELYAGVLTVRGSPRYTSGVRLLTWDDRGEREAYIEGVSHNYDWRTGQYVTQLRVTRMWYLDGAIDTRSTLEVETVRPDPVTGEVLR